MDLIGSCFFNFIFMGRPLRILGPESLPTYDYTGPGHDDLNPEKLITTGLPRGRTGAPIPPHRYPVDREGDFKPMPEGSEGIKKVLEDARGRVVEVVFQIPGEMRELKLSVLPEPLVMEKNSEVFEGELRAHGEPVVIERSSGEHFYHFKILAYRYREEVSGL